MKRFPRRWFLRGAGGAVLGLPFLDVFRRRAAHAQEMPPPRFAIFCRQGNGVAQAESFGAVAGGRAAADEPEQFYPRDHGPLTRDILAGQSDRALSELADYADQLLVVSGTRFAFPGNGCGHSGGGNQVLTAARVSDTPSGNESLAMGESIDNRIARELNDEGREPLTLFVGRKSGYLPEVLSYRGPRDLRSAENVPFNAYMRMSGLAGSDADLINAIRTRRRSVNDLVRDQMQSLLSRSDLSGGDRRKLELHFDSIRDLEVLMTCKLDEMREMELEGIEDPHSDGNYQVVARMQMDLLTLGVACGYTRTGTLQFGNGNDNTRHTIPGVNGGGQLPPFHQISHRINSDGSEGSIIEGAVDLHHEIDKMHLRLFRYLLDRLSAYEILDQGVAALTNDLGAGVSHTYRNVPWVLAGSCGGNLNVGTYLDARGGGDWVTHNQLFNVLLSAVGVRKEDGSLVDDFGDASLDRGFIAGMIATDAPDF